MEKIETYKGVDIMAKVEGTKVWLFCRYHPNVMWTEMSSLKRFIDVKWKFLGTPVKFWDKVHYWLKLMLP